MPIFPYHYDVSKLYLYPYATPATAPYRLFTPQSDSTTVHTKGDWQEICAALDMDMSGFCMFLKEADARQMWDLGIGASGNETVVLANGGGSIEDQGNVSNAFYVPLALGAGTRLAMRTQSNATANSLNGFITCFPSSFDFPGFHRTETIGADTSVSRGQEVDPGATPNTKGAWVELSSSTSFSAKWVIVWYTYPIGGAIASAIGLLDIGIGAAGNEEVILPDYTFFHTEVYDIRGPRVISLPLSIPAGSRVAVRIQSEETDSGNRLDNFHMTLFG